MKDFLFILCKSIFAGIFIAIAGWGFLANPMLGMFLFCVGLIGVIKYSAKLYTGTAGFIDGWGDIPYLLNILIGNIIGCGLVAAMALCSNLGIADAAHNVITARLANGWFNCGVLAIGCGILMSFAVQFARSTAVQINEHFSDWLPLLFAVPAFILCGFPHCVADAFYSLVYLFTTPVNEVPVCQFIAYYASIVVGNFIGCNVYNIFRM